ncbi:type II toxin-antitoxin system VapC family toxin [soil metagenome]
MEQPKYLIDTNSVIDYLGQRLPSDGMEYMHSVIDALPNISVITKIELLSFNTSPEPYAVLYNFTRDANVLDLNNNIVEACIIIRKNYKTKLPDAIIAASAIVYNLVLITRNISDFKNIPGLKTIDPYSLPNKS